MNRNITALFVTLLAGVIFLAGCAPAPLTAKRYGGGNAALIGEDIDSVIVPGAENSISVKITINKSKTVCEGEFKLTDVGKAYPPIMSTATYNYKGSFGANPPPECVEYLDLKEGQTDRMVSILDPVLWGNTFFVVCSAGSENFCLSEAIMYFKPLKDEE